eukprot:6781602-Alexandrium_andersonii.AAC.1
MLRSVLTVFPGGKDNENTDFLLEVMAFLKKGGYSESHPQTLMAMLNHFDVALAKDLAWSRANDKSAAQWWEHRKVPASLVLPEEATT